MIVINYHILYGPIDESLMPCQAINAQANHQSVCCSHIQSMDVDEDIPKFRTLAQLNVHQHGYYLKSINPLPHRDTL